MPEISLPSGKQFAANDGEALLDAALRHGIALEYSCRTGRCSTCKARVRAGTTHVLHEELGLSGPERHAGWILTCVRSAGSDVALDVQDLGNIELFASRTWPCRIQALERLSHDVMKVVLRLPPDSSVRYHPGQYLDVIGHAGLRRSYSIANAPAADKRIELHIRQVPEGAMSAYWFEHAKPNDLLRLHGPLGTFFLRDTVDMDLVFLATGTGIAPVKAMLEQLAVDGAARPRSVSVYWGGRLPADLYWNPQTVPLPHRYVPVLSRPGATWPGARGHVQHALLDDAPDLRRTVVYACGSDAMIHGARDRLLAAGLPETRFHSDAFVCSSAV